MVAAMSPAAEAQSLHPDFLVSLFKLDASEIGGPVLPFVPARAANGSKIRFQSLDYDPVDVEFTGLEVTGGGALPRPRLKLANTGGTWQAMLNAYGDLTGCTVQRLRVYAKFLDGRPDADPLAFYGPDVFRIDRKTAENAVFIEWELAADFDQAGAKLPRRTIVRETCLFRYRTWNAATETFDYSKAVCPYAGTAYFDINDQPVSDPAEDVPSRHKSCCVTRFGEGNPLPFGGFPGVARNS